MASTENLLKGSAKSTSKLETGYKSDDRAEGEQRVNQKQKGRFDRKKMFPRKIGVENKSFEGDKSKGNAIEEEKVKHSVQDHRTLSDIGSREQVPKGAEYGGRHSYASGRSFTDETTTFPFQRQRGKQRRSTPSEEDLRRRACLNSMRLRRASSPTQMPVTEVPGIDDKVLHDYTHYEKLDAIRTLTDSRILTNFRTDAIGNLTRVAEMDSSRLPEYSRRLSLALRERAVLEEELKLLRLTGSLMSFNDDDDWEKLAKTHFQAETANLERRANFTSNHNIKSSFEEPYAKPRQDRTLPNISISDSQVRELNIDDFEKKNSQLCETKQTAKATRKREELREKIYLSNVEKERRERKTAELAAHLWETLLQGQTFHVGEEPTRLDDSTSELDFVTVEGKNNSQRVTSKESEGTYNCDVLHRQSWVEKNSFAQPSISYNERQIQDVASNTSMLSFGETPKTGEFFCDRPAPHFARSEAFRRDGGGRKALRHKRVFHLTDPRAMENSAPEVGKAEVSNTPLPEQMENTAVRSSEHVTHDRSKWFGYMFPPGTKKNDKPSQGTSASNPQREATETGPPSISEKLLYYHELHDQRTETETVFDLADAYMAAEDFEAKRALQKTAAGEAAILRREASHLLWKAMNLERICDPNARVRHIFKPY